MEQSDTLPLMLAAIVHLSDIHFKTGKNGIVSKLEPLAAAICSTDPTCKDYVIVLSGDIAHSGLTTEYQTAESFFNALTRAMADHLPGATARFISVPGNHDCYLPKNEIKLREALVSAILPSLQTSEPDPSILESLLKNQKDYFSFSQHIGISGHSSTNRMCSSHTVTMANRQVQFLLYNTALLSQHNEQQGDLSLPMNLIIDAVKVDPRSDLVVSVFHHPYTWIESIVGTSFRNHIERTSEIALTGHEHFDHAFNKQPLTGETIFYSEGDFLQDPRRPEHSGFRIIILNFGEASRRVVSYRWTNSRFASSHDTGWQTYARSAALVEQPTPLRTFMDLLSDSGVGLTHRSKGEVPLEAVFVYQDATVSSLSASGSKQDVSGDHLLEYLSRHNRVLIHGASYTGKTSLAKTVVRSWLTTRSYFPLFISGASIRQGDHVSLDRLIHAECSRTYGEASTEVYRQLPTRLKALVIDDWDESSLGNENRNKFLLGAVAHFGKVVLLARGVSYVQYLLSNLKGTEVLLTFDLLSLKPLSHVARGCLVDNWLALGIPRDDKKFSREVEQTERLVQSVIGKNTLPSLPLIVLAILQASERNQDVLPENGSFGYLYEVLITSALNSTQGEKPQLDKKYAFLALLAFRLFEKATDVLGESAINDLLDEYAGSYRIKLDKMSLLSDLVHARVLSKEDGNYSFAYTHYFYYFLARYFKAELTGANREELRRLLTSIASGLNAGSNGIFLMFVIYLTHDEALIESLVRIGNEVLSEFQPSNLTEEVEFYNSKDFAGLVRQVPETIDLDKSRRNRRARADAARAEGGDSPPTGLGPQRDSEGYSDSLPLSTRFDYAFGAMEILGQILRNFTGSLPGEQKLVILRTVYLLGLRTLRAMLTVLGDATATAREEIEKRDLKKREDREFVKRVEKLLTVVGQLLGVSMIQQVSFNIGSPDIEEDAYVEALDKVGRSHASQLIDLSVRLDHFEEYPFNLIKSLVKEFRSNRFAMQCFRDLVISNMHVFDIGQEMRQRVLALLKARADDALLSTSGKRLKS